MTFHTARPHVLIVTRGFLYQLPAGLLPADLTFDLRRYLSDPAHRPEGDMLDMTGLDPAVRAFVLATPGAAEFLEDAVPLVHRMARRRFVVVHVGCAGGKHRASAVGRELGVLLTELGLRVAVRHLHVHRPRIIRPAEATLVAA
jgi:RNase adaptor protein for sRNA GlmZ degradation